jgi:hypothetical protein
LRDCSSGVVPACGFTDTVSAAEAALALPFESIAVAVNLCAPAAKTPVVKLQNPPASVSMEPSSEFPSNKFTILCAAAIPVNANECAVTPSPDTSSTCENDSIAGASSKPPPIYFQVKLCARTIACANNLTRR